MARGVVGTKDTGINEPDERSSPSGTSMRQNKYKILGNITSVLKKSESRILYNLYIIVLKEF